jgi:hypothetical protein
MELGRRIGAVRKINSWLYGASGRKFYRLARLAQIQLELLSQALSLVDSRLNF